jgi:hypothetical protein
MPGRGDPSSFFMNFMRQANTSHATHESPFQDMFSGGSN